MKIRDIGLLIENAEELENKLSEIEFITNSDESSLELVKFSAMLETDSVTYNIQALADYVKDNTESIELEYQRVTSDDYEGEPREYLELLHFVTNFNDFWEREDNSYYVADDEVAKRQGWLNYLDYECKNGELTEEEVEVIAEAIG